MNADSFAGVLRKAYPVPDEPYARAKWMGEAADACGALSRLYRREEAKEDVYFMKTTPAEMETLLRYREMIQDTARFAIMQRTLCQLLNTRGTSEAARQVFAVLRMIYGIPLRD